jgi:hypothetical protein
MPSEIPATTPQDPWTRTRRSLQKGVSALASASTEEECQAIGLLCRESVVTLAQAVTPPTGSQTDDGVDPSPSDAKRLLDAFIAGAAAGSSRDEERAFARACVTLASKLVHQRTATAREAALCLFATEATVRIVALMAGVESAGPMIRVGFEAPGMPRLLRVAAARREDLPSIRYRRRVQAVLARRRTGTQDPTFALYGTLAAVLGHGRPLESFTAEELEKELKDFDPDEWKEHDAYERFEEKAVRINLSLHNAGQQYLEDTMLWLTIPKAPGLSVAERVPTKPYSSRAILSGAYTGSSIAAMSANRHYPTVHEEDHRWVVSGHVGDLRHKLTTPAFGEPVRIAVTEEAAGKTFALTCAIHGRQLPDPIRFDLILEVLPEAEEASAARG